MRFLLTLLLLGGALSLAAQNSAHSISFRAGAKLMDQFEVDQLNTSLVTFQPEGRLGFSASLRYTYLLRENIGFYVGGGRTYTANTFLTFTRTPTADVPFGSSSGVGTDQSLTQLEFGLTFVQPIMYRLALVGEVGGQVVRVDFGGGSGSWRITNEDGEVLITTSYGYDENPFGESGVAVQVSPGIRYQVGDHFYLTLRGDLIFSDVSLIENGALQASSDAFPEPTVGSFRRVYGAKGLDLMATYRF